MPNGTPASAAHDAWEWQTATTDTTGRTRRISLAASALCPEGYSKRETLGWHRSDARHTTANSLRQGMADIHAP